MNRQLHNVMMAQYAAPKVSGGGLVSWDNGVKCVIPSVRLYGAAVQDGTPAPDAPVMPVCNDGIVVSLGRNLFNNFQFEPCIFEEEGHFFGFSNGKWSPLVQAKNVFRVGETYTYSAFIDAAGFTGEDTVYVRIWFKDINDTYISSARDGNGILAGNTGTSSVTVTIPEDCYYIGFGLHIPSTVEAGKIIITNAMVEPGSTASPYTPYYDGGQVAAPELWAIPGTDIRDEWDAQTGRGIRRCRKITLSPDKYSFRLNFNNSSRAAFFVKEDGADIKNCAFNSDTICSHGENIGQGLKAQGLSASYGGKLYLIVENAVTGADYTADSTAVITSKLLNWIALQYESGTPVEIIYALLNPEPFYHAPARLTQPKGCGQIIQTSGSIPACPIEASYLTHSGGNAR
ncbi:MAG: hypothetical protein PUB32_03055 [Clostridiales bacterium]|nr:hypothetical protein [Clostridiales bacterium]